MLNSWEYSSKVHHVIWQSVIIWVKNNNKSIVRFTKFVASIFLNCKGNSKSPITRRTSLKSLCFLASDVILPPTIGLKLNQLSAELFFSIVISHQILFIRKRLFQVAGNTFPLNYLDAITSLRTQKVYWTDMLRNIKFRHQREIRAILSWLA